MKIQFRNGLFRKLIPYLVMVSNVSEVNTRSESTSRKAHSKTIFYMKIQFGNWLFQNSESRIKFWESSSWIIYYVFKFRNTTTNHPTQLTSNDPMSRRHHHWFAVFDDTKPQPLSPQNTSATIHLHLPHPLPSISLLYCFNIQRDKTVFPDNTL